MRHTLLLAALESIINRAIPLDPVAEQALSELEGRSVAIHSTQPSLKVTAYFLNQRVTLIGQLDSNAHAIIIGPGPDLARQAFREHFAIGGAIELSGDQDLVMELQRIVKQLDLDWEEPLSRFLGDPLAHQVGQIGRGLFGWAKESMQTMLRATSEFIQEESKWTANRDEIKGFVEGVDKLRLDSERLELRVERLQQRRAQLGQNASPQNENQP